MTTPIAQGPVDVNVRGNYAYIAAKCDEHRDGRLTALERLAVVEEENRRLRAVIEEVHSWAVCACFATPEDMAENFPRIVEITTPNAS